MEKFLSENSSLIILSLFFTVVLSYLVIVRNIESKRILKKFERENIIISSFGVNYFGLESEPGAPLRSAGALVLLKDGIYYRARFSKRELYIPGFAIQKVDIIDTHKGVPLNQKVIGVIFTSQDGRRDRAAFRIPHSAQWIAAIRGIFLQHKQK
ncbi:MAG: hypothetical protein DRP87_07180 [Spirochaetes bacterium]|nr:MAG: hypothetical protein DRP87_07180 [Spirochaetota bacterium]